MRPGLKKLLDRVEAEDAHDPAAANAGPLPGTDDMVGMPLMVLWNDDKWHEGVVGG